MAFSPAAAHELALDALLHVAGYPDLTEALLAASGMMPDGLRAAAQDPQFHVAVLDFLLEDDQRVVDFAAARGIRPEEVLAARTALSGPGSFGWEAD